MSHDRAAVVARSIVLLAATSRGPETLERQVAVLLRDEFADVARQAANEIRLNDE